MSELYNVTNEPLTGGGIFSVMDPLGVPWEDYDMALELDMAYYGNYSGSKITSPLVDKLLENGVLSDAAMLKLANIILSINARRWSKEWDTLFADYDPISNYDMTEEMSEEGETNYGHTRTRTDNLAHTETRTDNLTHTVDGSEVEIPNVIMTEQESVRAFNSGSDQPSTKTTQTPQGNNRTDNDVTEHDTGTQAVQGTNSGTQSESEGGADSNSRDYTLTRRGNIGVTTSQQMLSSERELWMWNYFLEVVFPDVDKVLTTPVYLVSALSDESAGGITPTGRKNIYLNGVYDVTNYAEALVNVANSYSEADEGKVVDNGELVEQDEHLEIVHNGTWNTTLYKSVWVDVQNSYSVEDLGKVVTTVGANRRLVEQTSREITENGTYDTTLNNEVTVDVSIPVVNRAVWDSMTPQQKKSYGYVGIQDNASGYFRGNLLYGHDYPDALGMLPYSNEGSVICSAITDDYDVSASAWGYGSNPVILSAAGSAINADGSIAIKTKTDGTLAYVDLGENGKPFTAYLVAKIALANSSYTRLLSAMKERSIGQGIMLYGSSQVSVSSWASDTVVSPAVNPSAYFVGMIQYDGATSAKGAAIATDIAPTLINKSPYSAGRYITIGRTDIGASETNAEPTDLDVLYVGVTNVYESEDVVAGNMRFLLNNLINI